MQSYHSSESTRIRKLVNFRNNGLLLTDQIENKLLWHDKQVLYFDLLQTIKNDELQNNRGIQLLSFQ